MPVLLEVMRAATAILFVLFSTAGAVGGELTLEEVLGRHQQYLDRIRTVDATIEFWESTDRGATWSLTMMYRWLKDGPRERATMWANGYVDERGVRRNEEVRYDTSYAPDETRHLQRWNADDPPSEPPSPANRYHGAAAQVGKPVREGTISREPPFFLMLAPTLDDYLPAAVRSGSNVALTRTTFGGEPAWEVQFEGRVGVPAAYRVTLDPRRGYAPIRHEARSGAGIGISEVVEFREVEDGLFIPVLIRTTSPGDPETIYERRVTHLRVNEPVAAESLKVGFPAGMKVTDIRTFPGTISIWGRDGPRRTFRTPREYHLFELKSLVVSFLRRKAVRRAGWLLGVMTAVVILVVVRRRPVVPSRLKRSEPVSS